MLWHALTAAAPASAHRTTTHATKSAPRCGKSFVILEQNRIHDRVRFLRNLNGRRQRLATPVIDAIRQNDQRLPPLLLLHQLVSRQINAVVQQRPRAASSALSA